MEFSLFTVLGKIFAESGFAGLIGNPGNLIMIIIACVLLYMGIGKKYEPLLLVPIAFGMLLANLPFMVIQRYNRPRLVRLAALLRKREQKKGDTSARTDTDL